MSYWKRQQSMSSFFKNGELVYYNVVEGLQEELGCTHNPEEWRLFVDSSKFILNAVLLCKGNTPPVNTDCPLCPRDGNLRQYGFVLENYKVLKI
jgi:hypothetical protein